VGLATWRFTRRFGLLAVACVLALLTSVRLTQPKPMSHAVLLLVVVSTLAIVWGAVVAIPMGQRKVGVLVAALMTACGVAMLVGLWGTIR